jgi:hypothetical protein
MGRVHCVGRCGAARVLSVLERDATDRRIMFEGTPADLDAARSTLTGWYLAAYVGT